MKIAMTALAVVFLAQAAPALAQPGEPDHVERPELDQDRPQREDRSPERQLGDRQRQDAGQRDRGGRRGLDAPPAPAAVQAPQAPEARVPGDSIGRPGPWTPNAGRDAGVQDLGQDRGRDRDGDRHDGRRGDGHRDNDRWGDGRRGEGRRDWNDHRSGDHRGDNWRDWDRYDRRHDNHSRWERGRYPSAYFSSNRYRHAWSPPSGFYVRSWGFGEVLPRGWYGSGYGITDPWRFDLPPPPPGYDWVRAGDDALLIDQYSGRIVQVVRNLFW